ncbi:hypothetical protein [uncultured Dokdonia sp.]|uniref:hypothetical protein n=1 Tax=uncultured Dokdonia sp. TaxID=575653 RepID=UPI002633919D|nr:hypothetical protein [uncultured Dokdonia sp.]
MKQKTYFLLVIIVVLIIGIPVSMDAQVDQVVTPVEHITEQERFSIEKPRIGMTVYQTDHLSGLYTYTKDGWEAVPTTNKQLKEVLACSQITTVETVFDLNTIHDVCGTDVTTAIVLGYYTKGDGGGGIFVYNPSLDNPDVDGEGDGGLVFDGWKRSVIDRGVNVKWFGARGDGFGSVGDVVNGVTLTEAIIVSENTVAFQRVVDVVGSGRVASLNDPSNDIPGSDSNVIEDASPLEVTYGVFIPSGDYSLGEQALFREDFGIGGVKGFTYYSDGNATLTFTNTGNTYGFFNNTNGLFFTFRNITFRGVDASTNLMLSASAGVAQDYYFDRCTFRGQFNRIFTIRGAENGANTNSEWGFNKCTFTSHNALILDIKDSDQFLNYWFDQTKFWMTGNARVLKADDGGHFKFVNCDWSGFEPYEDTYLFELNGNGGGGISDFRITNGRFEMKSAHAKVLKSEWINGNIEINADFGSQAFQDFFKDNPNEINHFDIRMRETSGLNVSFKNSVLMGTHTYRYSQGSFRGTARAKYENCFFPQRLSLDGFIKIPDDLSNKAGISLISIEDAVLQGNSNTTAVVDGTFSQIPVTSVDYFPIYSNRGLKKKYFKIGNPARGGNPIGTQNIALNFPEDAESVITNVRWFLPEDRLTSTRNVRFEITDRFGAQLKDVNNDNIFVQGVMRDGYNKSQQTYINVKDLPEGKIILRSVSGFGISLPNQTAPEFICLIEYY